jgi:hypothetical protein
LASEKSSHVQKTERIESGRSLMSGLTDRLA